MRSKSGRPSSTRFASLAQPTPELAAGPSSLDRDQFRGLAVLRYGFGDLEVLDAIEGVSGYTSPGLASD